MILLYPALVFVIVFVIEHQRLQKINAKGFALKAALVASITVLVPLLFFSIYVFDVFNQNSFLFGNPSEISGEIEAKREFLDAIVSSFIAVVIPILTYVITRKLLAKHLK